MATNMKNNYIEGIEEIRIYIQRMVGLIFLDGLIFHFFADKFWYGGFHTPRGLMTVNIFC